MTLNEAIKHSKEVAMSDDVECNECRAEHKQLAEMLEELKAWRENPFKVIRKECEKIDVCQNCKFYASCHDELGTEKPCDWKGFR